MAIVQDNDAQHLISNLIKNGFQSTKLASTGGFLSVGNMTFISGVEDEKVEEVIEVIKNYSRKRTQPVPSVSMGQQMPGGFVNQAQVLVGGATIFVLDVEQFTRA